MARFMSSLIPRRAVVVECRSRNLDIDYLEGTQKLPLRFLWIWRQFWPFAISTSPIIHPVCPRPPPPPEQNNWQKHFFQFFLGRLYYPEINAKFGAQKRCIMGDAQMANKINQWTYCSLSLVSFFRLLNLPFLRKEINPAILTSRSSNVAQHILRCNLDARGFLVHQSGIKERNENTEKPLAPRQSRA